VQSMLAGLAFPHVDRQQTSCGRIYVERRQLGAEYRDRVWIKVQYADQPARPSSITLNLPIRWLNPASSFIVAVTRSKLWMTVE
jgi:hypothetical protein